MSTQGKGNEGFELVTSVLLGVVYSRLNYYWKRLNIYKLKKNSYIYRPLDCENQEEISVASWWDFWRESWPPHWFWTAIWRPFHRERRKDISSPRDEIASAPF
jgi:hypothetical protein